MRAVLALTVATMIAATAGIAPPARAQTPSELAAAQGWFNEGLAFEGTGQWKDALERFRRVAEVKHTPQVDFHVGLSESRVGELVLALVDLGRALEAARAQHVATVETAATAELAALRPRVPRLQIAIPPGAAFTKVTIDERTIAGVALAEPIAVDPGTHTVTVSFASGDVTQKVALAEKGFAKVNVEVPSDPAPAATTAAPTRDERPSPPATAGRSATLGWVLVAAGGAALVGGAVFWLMRANQISTLDAACGPDRQRCPESVRGSYDAGRTDTVVSAALFGAGALAAGVGAVLLVTRGAAPAATAAGITPLALPGGGGAAVSARF